jgi:uncharacterized protein YdhG (YjbR/CyaY superfamily)
VLRKLRTVVKAAVPKAKEGISYRIPAFWYKGILVYFAAFKDHIGFFPTSSGISAFQAELKNYRTSSGTVQFPLDKPMPVALIGKIVRFRVAENIRKEKASKR